MRGEKGWTHVWVVRGGVEKGGNKKWSRLRNVWCSSSYYWSIGSNGGVLLVEPFLGAAALGDGQRTISNQTHRISMGSMHFFLHPQFWEGSSWEGWSIFFKVRPLAVALRLSDGHPSSKNTRDLHIDPILWGSLVMDEFKILSTFLGVGPLNINCKHVAWTMGINSCSPNCIADITFTKYTIV